MGTDGSELAAEVSLTILDGEVVLRGPSELEAPWRTLWQPFLSNRALPDAAAVTVTPLPFGYALRSPGREVNVTDVWRALVESRNDAIRLGLTATRDVVDLHGAVLVRDEKALLLLGDAWAGKTTLALALVQRGWGYFSDDLVVIERSSGLVRPVPKPPGVKAYSWDQMKHYWRPLPKELGEPPGPFVIPPPFSGSLDARARPTWMVALEFREGGETSITPLSLGEGLARAAEHLGSLDANVVTDLARATQSVEPALLTYDSVADAVARLEELAR